MRRQAFLAGFGQVVRQQQDAMRSGLLGRLCALDREARGTAGAGNGFADPGGTSMRGVQIEVIGTR